MSSSLLITDGTIIEALREVYDPELGINVVDLGLIYGVHIDGADVTVTMTLTTPGCPLHDVLTEAVDGAVRFFIPGVNSVAVDLVWDPPWTPERISPAGRDELGWW